MKTTMFAVLLAAALPGYAFAALFPKPLHLVKRISDPLAKGVRTVDQYCDGDRIVTIAGDKVTVVDFAAQTMTEIDHARGTYAVSRFDEIANARPKVAPAAATSGTRTATAVAPKVTPNGMRSSAGGRSVDSFQIEVPRTHVVVGVDRSVTLSRAAVEALIGAAYPNVRRPEHDAILSIAAPARSTRVATDAAGSAAAAVDTTGYALPSEQSVTVTGESGDVTVTTSVLRFDTALPPTASMQIDPGAKRIESTLVRFAREMKDADTIPVAPRP